jgi:flagellin-like hook-associated protein FlgL
MSEAIQTIKAANVGIEGITNLLAQAKSLAQSAMSATSTDAISFASAYATVMTQVNEMASDSGYRGVNLLQSGELTVQFAPTADQSTLHLSGFGATAAEFSISGMSDAGTGVGWVSGTTVTTSTIQTAIDGIEEAVSTLRTEAKVLSNNLSIITAREEFSSQMMNTLNDGAAKLTEADMNEEGANMLMLQTRQALGTTSLSLASQAAQSVLRLF